MTETEIIKIAFNQGYTLQKKDPELALQIASGFSDPNIPYADGFISGAIEHIREQNLSPETLVEKVNKFKSKGQSESPSL